MNHILICGAGGFIGSHLVDRLKTEGFWVRGVDLKHPDFQKSTADEFVIGDLRNPKICHEALKGIDTVYQLAADMGGAGYLFSGDNDALVMHNSVLCNLNILNASRNSSVKKIFYASSACVYPTYNQEDPQNPYCAEDSVYPANPDSEYGWEKLFSERLYLSFQRNFNLDIRIARFHNIFGPKGTWQGGREKAPAALCRKVAMANEGDYIEVWGDGKQTRSFLYIDDCVEAVLRLMDSDFPFPINIGSEELISMNDFTQLIISVSGKNLKIKNVPGPLGVRGRTSHNQLIKEKLHWVPKISLKDGITKTYDWILNQVMQTAL